MKEVWKDISEFEGLYQVSNLGRVRNRDGLVKQTKTNNRGYIQICLHKQGKSYYKLMHRVVAEAFIPNPNELPQINHKDEDKNNNTIQNLEWCTNMYNRHFGTSIQRMAQHHNYSEVAKASSKPVLQLKDGMVIKQYESVMAASREVGISDSAIRQVCYGRNKNSAGFQWQYMQTV